MSWSVHLPAELEWRQVVLRLSLRFIDKTSRAMNTDGS
jgi:hypothetical protein